MEGKKASKKPFYPVEASLLGRKFAAATRLGFADFQENHRGNILGDGDLHQLFGNVETIRDLPQLGFFVGFVIGLHENPVESASSHGHLLDLGKGSVINCQTEAFIHGYHDGLKVFGEQCQTVCETGWDIADRLQVLTKKQCVRKFITDSRPLYRLGKATGWWVSFAKQSSLYGEIMALAQAYV
jgi:hypothetical protein